MNQSLGFPPIAHLIGEIPLENRGPKLIVEFLYSKGYVQGTYRDRTPDGAEPAGAPVWRTRECQA
ncbi:hypothetical protein Skr01_24110 [Sphaerisporangium krabiense]|nr:hypothetical protein Skr01_24110 [Sphaerisporangium krabiense]